VKSSNLNFELLTISTGQYLETVG